MNVTQENIDSLNAVITVSIHSNDLKEPVDSAIKKIGKTISMPGFRPGMVPMALVKKKYGKSVLADELNKITNKALFDFIRDNNIRFLGEPLISEERQKPIDLETAEEFNFHYDLGLVPNIQVNPADLGSFTRSLIKVDEKTLNDNIENLRLRYGKEGEAEAIEAGDMISGEFIETDAEGNPKEDGFRKQTFFIFDRIENEDSKNLLLGAKTDDEIKLHPTGVFNDASKTSVYLGITEEEAANLGADFIFKIGKINRIEPADLDNDFFDRLLGIGKVSNEEEFRAEMVNILSRDAQSESDVRLLNDIRAAILKNVHFDLPEKFLKRWVMTADKNITGPEAADEHMEKNRDGIRWEVIRMVLAEENQISASEEEIYANARSMVVGKLAEMGMPADDEDRLKKIVFNVLENDNEYNKIRSFIIEQKVLTLLRDKVTVNDVETDYAEFWKKNN